MKNEEKLREVKERLDFASGIIGRILDGELNQSQAAKELGMTPQTFGKQLQKDFNPYMKQYLSEEDIVGIAKELSTPAENLICDIFGISTENKMFVAEYESQEKLIELAREFLKEREFKVISMRYGLNENVPGKKGMILDEIGKELGVQRERVRQILSMSIRKLRSPKIWKQMIPDYDRYVQTLKELEYMQKVNNTINEQYNTVLSKMRWIQYREDICDLFNALFDQKREEISDKTKISDIPGITPEFVKALSDRGIYTIQNMTVMPKNIAEGICEELHIPMSQMEEYLSYACIFPDYMKKRAEITIDQMELSVRSYNVLKRCRIFTVKDIAEKGEDLKKLRNLGRKSYEEIRRVMKEEYGINIEAGQTLI